MACLSSVVRKMTAYQLNKYDANAFVELFDMCMWARCSVNCSQTFMLKVCIQSVHHGGIKCAMGF